MKLAPGLTAILLALLMDACRVHAADGLVPTEVPGVRTLSGPTIARQGMVAAAHPLAAKAGVDILRAGGSAIDALLATQMVLNVVEPQHSGIGGGCFILYFDARRGQTFCIDGREETPRGAQRRDFLNDHGHVRDEPMTGGIAVGVPGTVAALWLAHERWGKLSADRVLAPAIRAAEQGIGITPHLRLAIQENAERLKLFPASRRLFFHRDGSIPEIGEVWKQPELAATLRQLAAGGAKAFYEGPIAADLVRAVQSAPYQPGHLAAEDLQGYRAVFREPVRFTYRGHELVSMPPPSSGGITLARMLGILEQTSLAAAQPGSVEEIDWLARAGAAAFADRNAYLGDADWSPQLSMRALLDPQSIRDRARVALAPRIQLPLAPAPLGPSGNPATGSPAGGAGKSGHTTHISIVDGERNLVACTSTIENGMGSAIVVPGRGFLLNNELTDFDLALESGPNAIDPTRRPRATALADRDPPAGKRPRSSMTPALVFRDGRPVLTVGSPGGSYIIGVVAQVLVNVLDHGMDMQQALAAPRVSSQNEPLVLETRYANRPALVTSLKSRGWPVRLPAAGDEHATIGIAQGIRLRTDGTLEGGTDPRGEGAARGY